MNLAKFAPSNSQDAMRILAAEVLGVATDAAVTYTNHGLVIRYSDTYDTSAIETTIANACALLGWAAALKWKIDRSKGAPEVRVIGFAQGWMAAKISGQALGESTMRGQLMWIHGDAIAEDILRGVYGVLERASDATESETTAKEEIATFHGTVTIADFGKMKRIAKWRVGIVMQKKECDCDLN